MLVLGDGAAGFWNPLGEAQVLIASLLCHWSSSVQTSKC